MLGDEPDVAGFADCLDWSRGQFICRVLGCVRIFLTILGQQCLDLSLIKARQFQGEASILQLGQFQRQQFAVPASTLGQFVLGQDECALLRAGQVRQFDHWQLSHLQLACRKNPAMAGDDATVTIDQDRAVEAELPDAGCDLRDLLIAVRARIAGIGNQGRDRSIVDLQGWH